MSDNIVLLAPEPIALIDEEEEEENNIENSPQSTNITLSTFTIQNRRRSNSTVNSQFNFLKAQVSDCTLVTGDNIGKFAVWKITVVLQPKNKSSNSSKYISSPQFQIYKRYSEFVTFRKELCNCIENLERNTNNITARKCLDNINLPQLPPPVPWYNYWQYQDINLSKSWLLVRRRGLEYFINYVLLNKYVVEYCRDIIIAFLQGTNT